MTNQAEKILTVAEFEALREPTPADALPPDWQVYKVVDLGEGEYYRFRVEGFNLSAREALDSRFNWRVPALSHRYFFGQHYFSVIVPWSDKPTQWHPTEKTGPFATLSRGAFPTEAEAHKWATDHLCGQPYYLRAYQAAEYAA